MDSKAYFKAAASLYNYYSWEASLKHVVLIESSKELNHGYKAKDPS